MLKSITKFTTKSGKEVELCLPTLDCASVLLDFVNRLTKEDTYLSLTGDPKTLAEEENWIKNTILSMQANRSFAVWAIFNGRIVGSVDVHRGGTRDAHVGRIGLMVDHDFRHDGIGKYLLEFILEKAKKMAIKIVALESFADNNIAIELYKKVGFKEYGRLPKGFYRQGKYSDAIKMCKDLL